MMRVALILLATISCAAAQQQQDQPSAQRIFKAIQQQRNDAMDAAALESAKAAQLAEEVQKLKAEADKAKEAKPKE